MDSPNEECDAYADECDPELTMLREQIAMLSKQFFQDRQQWLEEKRQLQESIKAQHSPSGDVQAPSSQHGQQRISCSHLCSSEAGSEAHVEDASHGFASARECGSSFTSSSCISSRSQSPSGAVPLPSSASVSGANGDLLAVVSDLQRQLEESKRHQESAAVRWTLERETLQRQIHALINMSSEASLEVPGCSPRSQPHQQQRPRGGRGAGTDGGDGGEEAGGAGDSVRRALFRGAEAEGADEAGARSEDEAEDERQSLSQRVAELEALVEELQAERVNLEEQLRVVAADATLARQRAHRAATSDFTAAAAFETAAARAAASLLPSPSPSPRCSAQENQEVQRQQQGGGPQQQPPPPQQQQEPRQRQQQQQQQQQHAEGSALSGDPGPSPYQQAFATAAAAAGAGPADGGGARLERDYGLTLAHSVSMPELLAAKAELERELRRYKEECVAVPRGEYAEMWSARQQMAFLEVEMQQLRQETEEAVRLREAAEAELAQVVQDCVTVPREEYQDLLRRAAEARAREAAAVLEAPAQGCVSVRREEHLRLLAAMQERDALAESAAALQAKLAAAEAAAAEAVACAAAQAAAAAAATSAAAADGDDTGAADTSPPCPLAADGVEAAAPGAAAEGVQEAKAGAGTAEAANVKEAAVAAAALESEVVVLRDQLADAVRTAVSESARLSSQVRELEEEVANLTSENARLVADSGAVRNALATGRLRASDSAREVAMAAEMARSAAVGELAALQMRLRNLEADLAAARTASEAAWEDRECMQVELAAVRDAAVRTTEALAVCQSRREAAEQAAATAAEDLAAVTSELAALKLELSETREMEVRFRRDVLKSRRMLHVLPQEWMVGLGLGAASSPASGAGSSAASSQMGSTGGGGEKVPHARVTSETFNSDVEAVGPGDAAEGAEGSAEGGAVEAEEVKVGAVEVAAAAAAAVAEAAEEEGAAKGEEVDVGAAGDAAAALGAEVEA